MEAPLPANEPQRLEALRAYRILDTPPEAAFDDLARLAAQVCGMPLAAISLLDGDRVWFKARVGIAGREVPREDSVCAHAVLPGNGPLIVSDFESDPRFAGSVLTTGPAHLRAYAGVPLLTPEGHALGVLCVMDRKPRQFSEETVERLRLLARQVSQLLEMHKQKADALHAAAVLQQREAALDRAMKLARLGGWEHDLVTDLFTPGDHYYALAGTTAGLEGGNVLPMTEVIRRFVVPEDWPLIQAERAKLERMADPEWIGQFEHRLLGRDGQVRHLQVRYAVVRNDGGQPVKVCGVSQDVTAQKRAEAEFMESKRFLQATLDALTAHIAILDDRSVVIAVNSAWSRFAEENCLLEGSHGLGANYLELCETAAGDFSEEAPAMAQGIRAVMAGQQPDFLIEYPCHGPHEQRWFEARVTRFGGEGPVRVVVAHQDITVRKRAEEELQRKTALLEAQMDSSLEGVLVVDKTGRKTLQNERANEVFKMPRSVAEDPDDEQQVRWVAEQVVDSAGFREKVRFLFAHTSETYRDELELKNGLVLDRYTAPLWGKNGQYFGRVWTFRDITEQKRNEASLRESEEHFRSLFEHGPTAKCLLSPAGDLLHFNDAFCRLLRRRAEHLAGVRGADLSHPDDVAATEMCLRRLLTGEAEIQEWEKRYLTGDGGELWTHVTARLLRDVKGQPQHFLVDILDITERKRAEEVLQERLALQGRLAKIAANVPGVIYTFRLRPDGTSCIPYISPTAFDFFGLHAEEIIDHGEHIFDRIHPGDRGRLRESILVSAKKVAPWRQEFRVEDARRGGFIWLEGQSTPEQEPDGSVLWHGFMSDITEQKHAAEQLVLAKETADSANRAKSEFLATMSHEIRTPMNGLLGFTELLLETTLSAEQRQFVETIRFSGTTLLNLINDILDFSKIEAGKLVMTRTPFKLFNLVEGVVALLGDQARRKGLTLCANYDPTPPQRAIGDPDRVRQVLLNLVGNAIKFTKHGSVSISLLAGLGTVRCEIADTGIGIPVELHGLLFQRFSQVGPGAARQNAGTGLGLAISKRLVELMGGEIGFVSEPGRGSTFWFKLPAETTAPATKTGRSVPAAGAPPEETVPPPADGHGLHVLLVEDNLINKELMVYLLEKLACSVEVAANGIEATHLFAQNTYDLIFMDCLMPEMDGWEATRQIRHLEAGKRRVPIIAITASLMREQRRRCLEAGMDGLLEKPVQFPVLQQVLRQWTQPAAKMDASATT
ncbi:MAG: PAS domain S-box protein [Verrucomicrobiae bacterium]|nr:PAS domain S-box protein [Verrucomicrobiae bacterium]